MTPLEFYAQFMDRSSTVFDIGANMGERTDVFSALAKHVVAVEPQGLCQDSLQRLAATNGNVSIVKKAVGSSEGIGVLRITDDAHTLSSMSDNWIKAVSEERRFGDAMWNRHESVDLTTLDTLIKEFGVPDFIKIDVEGSEPQVIRGLSRPVKTLSFEFVPCVLNMAKEVLDHLAMLGPFELNYGLGEEMELVLPSWVDTKTLRKELRRYTEDNVAFGDVYVRFL